MRDLTTSKTEKLDDYDKKYVKVKFYLKKELTNKNGWNCWHDNMIILIRSVFHESNKYYLQVFYL